MGCCGQGRAALARSTAGLTGARETTRPRQAARRLPKVGVRYSGHRAVRVRGTATGRIYSFTGAGVEQAVDAADVPALIRTGLFARR
jgi:hypothetical protein